MGYHISLTFLSQLFYMHAGFPESEYPIMQLFCSDTHACSIPQYVYIWINLKAVENKAKRDV